MGDLKKLFDDCYDSAIDKWIPFWTNGKKALEFKMGKQWDEKDKAKLGAQQRDPLVFNRVRRILHTLSGIERKNRLSLRIMPTAGDKETAAIFSSVVQWVMAYENGYLTMSKAFENGPCTTGLNLVELYMDYSEDPLSGDIKFARCAYNEMMFDPHYSMEDGSDIGFMLRRRWLTLEQAKMLIPGHSREIKNIKPKGKDSKFPETPMAKDFRGLRYKFDQIYRREVKKQKFILSMLDGQYQRWEKSSKDLDAFLNSESPAGVPWGQFVKAIDRQVPTIKTGYLLEDIEMYDGPDPTELDEYPFVFMHGYFEPEYNKLEYKIQGLAHTVIDAQIESNRRRLKLLDILDSQVQGALAKEGKFIDDQAPYRTGQGNTIWMTEDADMGADFQQIKGPGIPPGLFETSKLMDEDMDSLPGLAGEVTGMPDAGEAAQAFILAKLRLSAGLTVFQPLMDSRRDADKNLGQKLVKLIQIHFHPTKVQRITERQPTKEFYDKTFGKYDCIPCEGALTDSQRQMKYGELISLKTATNAPIPWSMIFEYSSLEVSSDIIKRIQQQENMQQQIGMLKMQTEIMREKARGILDAAKAKSVESKSGLDRVKAMEELANMSDERAMRLLELVMKIEKEGGLGVPPPQLPQPERQRSKLLPAPAPRAQVASEPPAPQDYNWRTIGGDDLQ